jgi:hypothetical protein
VCVLCARLWVVSVGDVCVVMCGVVFVMCGLRAWSVLGDSAHALSEQQLAQAWSASDA